jgi:hypothetical protein
MRINVPAVPVTVPVTVRVATYFTASGVSLVGRSYANLASDFADFEISRIVQMVPEGLKITVSAVRFCPSAPFPSGHSFPLESAFASL